MVAGGKPPMMQRRPIVVWRRAARGGAGRTRVSERAADTLVGRHSLWAPLGLAWRGGQAVAAPPSLVGSADVLCVMGLFAAPHGAEAEDPITTASRPLCVTARH